MKLDIEGSIVAIVTPMLGNGDVDLESLKTLVEWHVVSGTSAIVAVGTTGESPVLDVAEYRQVVNTVVQQAASRIPVIAGTGASSTKKAIELTKIAADLGVDASLSVTPYYNKPQQHGLIQHYTAVAAAAEDIPLILYNVPSRTAVDLLPETVSELADIENIVALKEAVQNSTRQRELIQLVSDKIDLLSGDDESCLDFILAGAKGVISVTANVAPIEMSQMCRLALNGDSKGAKELHQKLLGLHQDLFVESNPIPAKWLLSTMGKISNGIRLPLTPLSFCHHKKLALSAKQAGISIHLSGEM